MRIARPSLAQLRSITGVVIGMYVTMHLANHALGLISLNAQETARPYVMALWHSPPGQVLLYGSLSVHAICALGALVRRRQHRMPIWEATQILLGLAIPYLLLVHIVNTASQDARATTLIIHTKSPISGSIRGHDSAKFFWSFWSGAILSLVSTSGCAFAVGTGARFQRFCLPMCSYRRARFSVLPR